jgi:hypothetical protein
MSDLNLDSLRIQNFRTFKDLTIDRLGRVNLIVGKNNVGKTALLEALWVWARRGRFSVIWKLLNERDETLHSSQTDPILLSTEGGRLVKSIFQLFYGREADFPKKASIGPSESSWGTLDIQLYLTEKMAEEGDGHLERAEPLLVSSKDSDVIGQYPLIEDLEELKTLWGPVSDEETVTYIRSNGLQSRKRLECWDEVIRSVAEDRVYRAPQIVDDRIQDIQFIGRENAGERVPIARVKGFSERIPLRSLGEGVRRGFDIGLAMERSSGGILLIDEIENGLHYSVQPDLWQVIFETAQELDVQVFATTHSYDCVQAFQQVAQDYERSESMLVSLRRREEDPEDIVAVLSDRDELGTVVEENIEVR